MTTSDETKMKALLLLKDYHGHLVEINRISDVIKKHKLYFNDQIPLADQLIELYSNNDKILTEVIVKNGRVQENSDDIKINTEIKESTLVNRKNNIKTETKDETLDVDDIKMTASDCIIKNNYYLDFSKQQRSKRLINDIKKQLNQLLTKNINELVKIKNEIAAL